MKKAIPLLALSSSLLLGVAAASLIGCANSETETADTTESAETETTSTDSTEAVERGSDDPVIKPGDWKQWGGTSYRNNVPVTNAKIPTDWNIGAFDRRTQEWKPENAENIKWVSQLGSQSYGNPVVADGRVYVGTNNGAGHLPRYSSRVDLGCMLCFRESDGKFLWQHSSEKLPTGRVHDWPLQGICCAPYIDGDRVYFVSSRGEVVCLDAEGFYDDEDDGEPARLERGRLFDVMPTEREGAEVTAEEINEAVAALDKGEIKPLLRTRFAKAGFELSDAVEITATRAGQTWMVKAKVNGNQRAIKISKAGPKVSAFKLITTADKDEADEVWSYNMMDNLKISQHNMCSCSITALGDLLFINTSNGLDESHENLPAPSAPSFICMDKNTAEVYWTDQSPGRNILHGQWSSPTVAMLGGVPQVIFAGGDGWVYSFKADKGNDGDGNLLWKFDANPKDSKWELLGSGTRNNIIATPVVYDGKVYVAVGQDPEHGEGIGHLWCLDPNKRGDVSPQLVVSVKDRSKIIPHRRLQAVEPENGEVAIDNKNSAAIWHYHVVDVNKDGEIDFEEEMHRSCGTVAIKDDLLYIADFSGLFHCLDAQTGKRHWVYDMLAAAWGSPLIVNDHVYIGDEDGDVCVFNLTKEQHDPIAEINMANSVYSTPIVANGVLYIANRTHLFAIESADGKTGAGGDE